MAGVLKGDEETPADVKLEKLLVVSRIFWCLHLFFAHPVVLVLWIGGGAGYFRSQIRRLSW